jgi:hypothetical protein
MPYPETCPECGGAFRNTGTHYTARRNEVGRHVLLELGCQNTSRRYWWDFTSGNAAEDSTSPAPRAGLETSLSAAAALNGVRGAGSNGSAAMATLERPLTLHPPAEPELSEPSAPVLATHAVPEVAEPAAAEFAEPAATEFAEPAAAEFAEPAAAEFARHAVPELSEPAASEFEAVTALEFGSEPIMNSDSVSDTDKALEPSTLELPGPPPTAPASLKDAFVRQLQLDRLTLRQMRSWLMSDDARRAIEVAAGATEATYERLALILFGVDLPQLLGKQPSVPASQGMSAEERLELQREKARIRARLRRAAAKAARNQG